MVSNKKIKVGIIGPGGIGYAHIDSLRRLENVEVTAIAARNEDRAKFYARKYSIDNVYADYRKLIEDKQIEVVHIATPNYLHFPQAKYALEAGKHVICDKPLGMNSTETLQLLKLAGKKGIVHAVNFNFRFFPIIQQAEAICRKKELGEIFFIRGGYLSDEFLYPSDYNWRMNPEKGGPSLAVSAVGCHWLDLIQSISGLTVKSVFAEFANIWRVRQRPKEIFDQREKYETMKCPLEEYASVLLRFSDSKAKGNLILSHVTAGKKFDFFFEISGSQGSMAWNLQDANELWRGFRGKPNETILRDPALLEAEARKFIGSPAGEIEGYRDSFKQHFRIIYEYIANGEYLKGTEPSFPTFKDGHNIQLIIDAVVASAKNQKWVEVRI